MTRRITELLLALGLLVACATKQPTNSEPLPAWLAVLTHQLESQPVANPPSLIAHYDYKGQAVYYLPPRCCDLPSNLYDAAGSILCHPDGGFSGSGDGLCTDFMAQRTNEKIVWRDPRSAT